METVKLLVMVCLIACLGCTTPHSPALQPDSTTVHVISLKSYPNEASVRDTIIVIAEIKNTGEKASKYPLALNVEGKEGKKRDIEIAANATRRIPFQFMEDTPGEYQVFAGNKRTSFQIREKQFYSKDKPRIALFLHENTGPDHILILPLLEQLGISFIWADYKFINDRDRFFDKSGERKFDVLFFAGGEAELYFSKTFGSEPNGIAKSGAHNIWEFINKGGACIATCMSGPAMFTKKLIWIGIGVDEASSGKPWKPRTNMLTGFMPNHFGVEPLFKGVISGPQETNQPYPQTHFLPIRLDTDHPLIRKAHLPETAYLCTIGSGSLIPDKDQPMEVLGWFPNGTAAMGIVKYGKGHLYLISPHPVMTIENAGDLIKYVVMGTHARRWGWDEKQIRVAQEAFDNEGDPDGPEPDYILMKAILQDALERSAYGSK